MNSMIFYRCDCQSCPEGCETHSNGACDLTTDPEHARNFEMVDGMLVEKPDGRNLHLNDRGPYVEV